MRLSILAPTFRDAAGRESFEPPCIANRGGGLGEGRFLRLAFAFTLALSALPALAQPKLPPLTGRVVDLANVMSPVQEAAIAEQLAQHEMRTSNQVIVATLPSLQGYDIERFAVDLFRAWGLGQKDRNNGVLLLVAPAEREVRIEVGYGLEGTLTDALSSDIIRSRILPRFQAGDLPGGVSSGVDAILSVIEGTYKPISSPARPQHRIEALAPFLMVLTWILLVTFLSNRRRMRRRVWGPGMSQSPLDTGRWSGRGGFGVGRGGFSGGGGRSGGGGASGRW
ncbi:MAG TPA: TPM domain-containing protein [Alphaproteobacteria bacterium]|nr:TPM domain-containing protein [Alphaproteobacteria bacterium]